MDLLEKKEKITIPEAKDAFEKQVAVTIASLAVVLAVIGNKGDNAKTDAIIKTNDDYLNAKVDFEETNARIRERFDGFDKVAVVTLFKIIYVLPIGRTFVHIYSD